MRRCGVRQHHTLEKPADGSRGDSARGIPRRKCDQFNVEMFASHDATDQSGIVPYVLAGGSACARLTSPGGLSHPGFVQIIVRVDRLALYDFDAV